MNEEKDDDEEETENIEKQKTREDRMYNAYK